MAMIVFSAQRFFILKTNSTIMFRFVALLRNAKNVAEKYHNSIILSILMNAAQARPWGTTLMLMLPE